MWTKNQEEMPNIYQWASRQNKSKLQEAWHTVSFLLAALPMKTKKHKLLSASFPNLHLLTDIMSK